jgi:hypothetical protein
MIELYVYSTKMSPENQGVFQFMKEVIFQKILTICSSWEGRLLRESDGW